MLLHATPKPDAQNDFALTLEPDFSTLWLDANGPRVFVPCNPWPIQPYQPRAFNVRGQIFNSSADQVGTYFSRGWIRQSDGAHVADYALTIKGIGVVVYSIDALPDAANVAEFNTFVFSGTRRNTPLTLIVRPRTTTDCPWDLRWEITMTIEE